MEERERRVAAREELGRGGESVSSAASSGIGCETERDRAGEWGESVSVTDGGDMMWRAETRRGGGRECVRQDESGHDTVLQLYAALCLGKTLCNLPYFMSTSRPPLHYLLPFRPAFP